MTEEPLTQVPRWWDTYAKQEYMTPGVEETLTIMNEFCDLRLETKVLEVAFGKGEAACQLAMRHGCRVVGIDKHSQVAVVQQKAADRLLGDRVSFVRGDGGLLPIGEASFDVCLCTGGPSIAGG